MKGDKYLGALCSRKHDHYGDGRSLRYKSTRTCVRCCNITAIRWRKNNPKRHRQLQKAFMSKIPEGQVKTYMQNYYINKIKPDRIRARKAKARMALD
jgi:hypothetical protein